jgi:hypothetical protein
VKLVAMVFPSFTKLGAAKMLTILGAKIPALAKLTMVSVAVISTALVTGMPVHDIWFDYVLFVVISAIVGGMPEPDTDLPTGRFIYTWAYRTGHLMVASATAYFLHQRKWDTISDGRDGNSGLAVHKT